MPLNSDDVAAFLRKVQPCTWYEDFTVTVFGEEHRTRRYCDLTEGHDGPHATDGKPWPDDDG